MQAHHNKADPLRVILTAAASTASSKMFTRDELPHNKGIRFLIFEHKTQLEFVT